MNWWQRFTDSFETKGAQILLLWITDLLFVFTLLHYEKTLTATTVAVLSGLVGGVNGAFLGAMGARQANGNGNGSNPNGVPDKLTASLVPAAPIVQPTKKEGK